MSLDRRNTISQAGNTVAEEVIEIWQNKNQIVASKWYIVEKIRTLHEKYKFLLKLKNRNSNTEQTKRNDFIDDLYKVFDIKGFSIKNPRSISAVLQTRAKLSSSESYISSTSGSEYVPSPTKCKLSDKNPEKIHREKKYLQKK